MDQLDTPAGEEGITADEECVGLLAHKRRERFIELATGADVEDSGLKPDGAASRFHVLHRLDSGVGWVDQHGYTSGPGHQLTKEFQPLCRQLAAEKIDPSHSRPAGPGW